MRERLARGPWWVQGLFYGMFFGSLMTMFRVAGHERFLPALGGAAVSAAVFGVGMGLFATRQRRYVLGDLDRFTSTERATILQATRRGVVPEDEKLRDAARAVLQRRLEQLVRMRPWSTVLFAVMTLLSGWLAAAGSPWFALGIPMFLGMVILVQFGVGQLRRRIAALHAIS